MRIGQDILQWLLLGLQWLGGRVWNFLVVTFWVLIQVLELLFWAVSELKARVYSWSIALKKVVKQKKIIKLFLWPLQAVFLLLWQAIVQCFWLLVQLIEMIAWYLEIFQKVISKKSAVRESRKPQKRTEKK